MLNGVLATNPLMRFLTSMTYLSNINGLSKIYYRDSSFLKKIRFHKLSEKGKPFIYHNAWNLSSRDPKKEGRLQLFANRPEDLGPERAKKYRAITDESLCACSALPYVESTVNIDGIEYCEGALIDTVNFKDLVEDHPDVEEVWVSRIVDVDQVRAPRNMVDALSNLCMLFAAEVGANDVKLFKQHLKECERKVRVIEVPVSSEINFKRTHSNLDKGIEKGCEAVFATIERVKRMRIVEEMAKAREIDISYDVAWHVAGLPQFESPDVYEDLKKAVAAATAQRPGICFDLFKTELPRLLG